MSSDVEMLDVHPQPRQQQHIPVLSPLSSAHNINVNLVNNGCSALATSTHLSRRRS
ncbi:hypothetical protein AX17_002752 [Amanita inopinata Kibby_2008]|nr:hypothetical protein AX17_002752 [Amanita inopinata Kibby_2008]